MEWEHIREKKKKKSKSTAKVFHTSPNQEFFTKMENIPSAFAPIHPLIFIFSGNTSALVFRPGLAFLHSALAQPHSRWARTEFTV